MYHFKNLMVGLTLGGQDKAKILYAGLVSWLTSSEKITFSHIVSSEKILKDSGVDVLSSIEESEKRLMEELVNKYYDGRPATRLEYEVVIESPLVEIDLLRRIKEKEIDLIIIGRIHGEITAGETIPVKISRKVPCSTLYIPEEVEPERKMPEEINILVPIDFSENALDAMDLAAEFAAAHEIPSIYSAHVYDVPLGYYKRGKSYEEFAEIMKSNAEKKYQEFIKKIDLKGVFVKLVMFRLEKKAHETIEKAVEEYGIDLIIIGSRGKKAAARFLLESVTEQLIRTTTTPLLVFKKKGKDMSLLEALLRL